MKARTNNTEVKTTLLYAESNRSTCTACTELSRSIRRGWGRLFLLLFILGLSSVNAQVGIGTENPDASAVLDVDVTSLTDKKGFLPPRMTQTERNAITDPAEGLMIYNSTQNCMNVFVEYWRNLCAFDNTASIGTITFDGLDYETVFNPVTGLTWLDRNLGASQVAASSTDSDSYGDLYQWGRAKEGHESRTSSTYIAAALGNTEASTATPNSGEDWDGDFIIEAPFGWLLPPDDDLWQGVNGENNPCPNGYRLPTEAEWLAESSNWNNPQDAFESVLKLSAAGYRVPVSNSNFGLTAGDIEDVGDLGNYWSSTIDGPNNAKLLDFIGGFFPGSSLISILRSQGASVRCIKD